MQKQCKNELFVEIGRPAGHAGRYGSARRAHCRPKSKKTDGRSKQTKKGQSMRPFGSAPWSLLLSLNGPPRSTPVPFIFIGERNDVGRSAGDGAAQRLAHDTDTSSQHRRDSVWRTLPCCCLSRQTAAGSGRRARAGDDNGPHTVPIPFGLGKLGACFFCHRLGATHPHRPPSFAPSPPRPGAEARTAK